MLSYTSGCIAGPRHDVDDHRKKVVTGGKYSLDSLQESPFCPPMCPKRPAGYKLYSAPLRLPIE
jgi:hypothetical protein